MEESRAYAEANRDRFINELKELCAQPSVAGQGSGLEETARLVQARLKRLGAQVRRFPVDDGPPIIYAELGQGARTLLVYNHYDVQPPDPLDLWESPPFELEVREGKLFGRGVADNKGDLLARLQAIEAYQATIGRLPLKLKFVIEGEEEKGSPHLAPFAAENATLLAADGCLWETGDKDEGERFTLYLGVKGIMYLELWARGANSDLHSSLATIVPNPAWRLVWALATLKDTDDRILVDSFMDHVAPPTAEEIEFLKTIPFEEEQMRANWGIPAFIRDLSGLEALKKHLYEPTCTICGMRSGYIGEGPKTVLPNEAMVKLDFRLVPNLEPDVVVDLLRKHLDRRGFTDVEIVPQAGEHPATSPVDAPVVKAAIAAAEVVYGHRPVVYPLTAGTGPMYPLSTALGIPAVMAGISYPGSNIHAPNENIRLEDYFEGIHFMGELIRQFSEE